MASETSHLLSKSEPLAKGVYAPPLASASRSPCPIINSLANHGYLPRDGRDVLANEITSAVSEVGIALSLRTAFKLIFLEHQEPATPTSPPSQSLWAKIRNLVSRPLSTLISKIRARFGVRRPGQTDAAGRKCINLDQLSMHGKIEHDVSLSRHDQAQGDNHSAQVDLIADILAASSDGGKTLTVQDLAGLRKRRIEKQTTLNPKMQYGEFQHELGCGEIALLLGAFGDGQKVRCDYVKAIFEEERLPVAEGWKKRWWWQLGVVEAKSATQKIKRLVGVQISE